MTQTYNELLKDEFLCDQTMNFTKGCLDRGMCLTTVCRLVKEYILCYNDWIHIPDTKKEDFTMEEWWTIKNSKLSKEELVQRMMTY